MSRPLQTAAVPVASLLLVYAVFLLLRGHDQPGGGFVAGLVTAAAIELVALAHGRHEVPALVRRPRRLILAGFAIGLTAGALGWFKGAFLHALWLPGTFLGYKMGTPVLFDTGIALLVAGSASAILVSLEEP